MFEFKFINVLTRIMVFFHRYTSKKSVLMFMLVVFYFFGGGSRLGSQVVIVTWNKSIESDLAGYKIYYGKVPRKYEYVKDAGMVTEYTIAAMPDTGTFYFAVTAYDSSGVESIYSAETSVYIKIKDGFSFFSLRKNYPNPFNPLTRIPYYLFEKLALSLIVYDLLGREVKILEKGEKPAGKYEIEWDGTDNSGNPVANGVYICRLLIGDFCQTRKLMLIR